MNFEDEWSKEIDPMIDRQEARHQELQMQMRVREYGIRLAELESREHMVQQGIEQQMREYTELGIRETVDRQLIDELIMRARMGDNIPITPLEEPENEEMSEEEAYHHRLGL